MAPIATPPDVPSAWKRKVGAGKGSRGLRGSPPGRAAASHWLCHLHLHREGRAGWGAGGSVGGRCGAPIGGCWWRRGWGTPSVGLQAACAVSRGLRGLVSLPLQPAGSVSTAPIQLGQHAGQRVHLSIQTAGAQAPPVWGEPLGALGCSVGPHPGWPPVIASPGGLVTLLRWEGAKIDPGVGLECCSVGGWQPRGTSRECSPLRGSGGLRLLWGEPGGPRHGLERGEETPNSRQGLSEPRASDFGPLFRPTPRDRKSVV